MGRPYQETGVTMRRMNAVASVLFKVAMIAAATVPAANAAPAGDACALLTPAEVGAALGVPVGAGAYVTPTFKRTCTWTATWSGGGIVTLLLQDVSGFDGGKRLARMGGKDTSLTPVSGLGDDAYLLALGTQVGLTIKKGRVAFKVALYAEMPVARKEATEKAIARQVAARL